MATYTTSKRLIKEYKTCSARYMGIGPVGVEPKRLKISSFFCSLRKGKIFMLLQVVS